jgi:hypothetical protein
MNNNHQHITEEREWQIFELLEGNLKDTEAQQLLNEIKSNPIEWKFYQEMKCTYLNSESAIAFENTITYPLKDSLKLITKNNKKGTVWIGFTRNKNLIHWSVAASIAIVLGIGAFMKFNTSSTPKVYSESKISTLSPSNSQKRSLEIEETTPPNLEDTTGQNSTKNLTRFRTNPATILKTQIDLKPHKLVTNTIPSPEKNKKDHFIIRPIEIVKQSPDKRELNPYLNPIDTLKTENSQSNAIIASNFIPDSDIKVIYASEETENQYRKEEKALKRQWIREAVQELKYGRLPEVRLSTRKQKDTWVPEIGINIASKSMVLHTTFVQK